MGQKVNPHGMRVGVIKNWDSRWYASKEYFGDTLVSDYQIRKYLKKALQDAGIPKIEIERDARRVRVFIHCAKPGMVIGKGGSSCHCPERRRRELIMLMPKRTKFRRVQRGRMKGKASRGTTLSYGSYGLMATEPAWISSVQIEAARIAMTRYIKRGGQVWIKIFPDKPITEKPAETRMGSGKGSVEYWVAVVKPGRIMFEMDGIDEATAKEAMRLASNKLPIKTKFVTKAAEEA